MQPQQEQIIQQTPVVVKFNSDGTVTDQTTESQTIVKTDWKDEPEENSIFAKDGLSSKLITVSKAVQANGMVGAGHIRGGKVIMPNEKCPCNSGKKYKKCCRNR